MKLYFVPYAESNITNNATFSETVDRLVNVQTMAMPILSMLIFLALYGYKVVKKETCQFAPFLPYQILSLVSISYVLVLCINYFFSNNLLYQISFFIILITIVQPFLVFSLSTIQSGLVLFNIKITNMRKFTYIALPVLIVIKWIGHFRPLFLEINNFQIELEVFDLILAILNIVIVIGLVVMRKKKTLVRNPENISILLNGLATFYISFNTLSIYIWSRLIYYPEDEKITTVSCYYYMSYISYIWIVSVYIGHLKLVQRWVEQQNLEKSSEEDSGIQMTSASSNLRRASVDTTVSYLSISDVHLRV